MASTDTTNTPLQTITKLNKHLIISTGATSEKELRLVLNKLNFKKKKYLFCIVFLIIPVYFNLNLNVLKKYRKKLKIQNIGFSIIACILSGSLAVCVEQILSKNILH